MTFTLKNWQYYKTLQTLANITNILWLRAIQSGLDFKNSVPVCESMASFLKQRCRTLENMEFA